MTRGVSGESILGRRSNSLLGSRSLDNNRSRLTDPLGLGTLIYRHKLSGRDRGLGRNPLCSNRSSRNHGLSYHIGPIKEALYGCTHGSRDFLNREVIDGDRLELNLNNVKQRKK